MAPMVKVIIPELASVTLLDHRDSGSGGPCIATTDAVHPIDILQDRPATEKVSLVIRLEKFPVIGPRNDTCVIYLVESIEGSIRGFDFFHSRTIEIGSRHVDDCR